MSVVRKLVETWVSGEEPQLAIGVVDSYGAVTENVMATLDDYDTTEHGEVYSGGLRWRFKNGHLFCWQDPNEDEKNAVINWLVRKRGFEVTRIHGTMLGCFV